MLARILSHYGNGAALAFDGRSWSYAEVIDAALSLGAVLDGLDGGPHQVIGLLADKSPCAYIGLLAAHLAGKGYMPLNPKFPVQRLASMVRQSGARAIVAGPDGARSCIALFAALGADWPLTCVFVDGRIPSGLDRRNTRHVFLTHPLDRGHAGLASPRQVGRDATAYLLFTSGSTGAPKGVPVSFANLSAYLSHAMTRFPLEAEDRASQTFDLTFDLSVHDIFLTWSSGACLYPLADATLLNAAKFIRWNELTAWFAVPSVAMLMTRARTLQPGAFPSLQLSLFCGEALPVATAEAWTAAAPASRLINLYGPTETTIAITEYEWDAVAVARPSRHGVVPLGRVFPGQRHCLLSEDGRVLTGAGRGELCLAGTQVTGGYLGNSAMSSQRFVTLPDRPDTVWYRTGDLVEEDGDGLLHFLGRTDFQVKVNGFRIELAEMEEIVRRASGRDAVVALPCPAPDGTTNRLVAFILGDHGDAQGILAACRDSLPHYMVPSRIIWLNSFPLNANGKIDRVALAARLTTGKQEEFGA